MIIRDDYTCEGVDFITSNEYSQQVAYMHYPTGKMIEVKQSPYSGEADKKRFTGISAEEVKLREQ